MTRKPSPNHPRYRRADVRERRRQVALAGKRRWKFLCLKCGHASHADENGSQNIRALGLDALRTGAFIRPNAEATTYAN